MGHPPRVVSSRVSWLITIVLSLTGAFAHATTCDVDADGDIDRKDYLAILADIGERASGPNDPRDADRNGRILSNDPQLCARRCTLPLCDIPAKKPPIAENKAPIAKNDTATTALDKPVRINVIANDTDRDGRVVPSTVSIVTKPKQGNVTNHRNGTVTYSPALGFRGRDSFRYTAKDNRGATSNVATVTVTVLPGNVQPGNVPPVAKNDSAATSVNTPVTINVVANDTDANGNLHRTSVAVVANPANGRVVKNGIGTVTYTPNSGFFGTDRFTYNVKDTPQGALSNTATVTVGVNAAPTADAGPDANAVTGQPVTLDGSGSSDPNGNMITFSWRFLSTAPGSNLADADIVNPRSPAPSFTPDMDGAYELELTVTDPRALSDTDTVLITAATANVAPNADAGLNQNAEVLTLVNLDGSGSSDPDNGPATPLTFQWSIVSVPVGSGIDETDLQPDANSTQPSFTPDVIGLYRLTLTVSDGDLSDFDDVDITVALPNVPPNADAGSDIVVQLGPPAQTATLNGTGSNDPDNGPVTPLTFEWTFVSLAPGSSLTNGDIQNANTDTASFTPDAAGVYTLQLRVFDGLDEGFNAVMVTANAAPVALADAFDVDEDTPLTVPAPGVLTNDADANSDPLIAVLDSGPTNAQSFTLNADGSFDYTPNADFTSDDSFTYHANDGSVDSNVATVTITVNPANDVPVAVNDPSYTTDEDGGALAGTSVLANDTDAENDTLIAILDTGPTNASAFNLNADGTFSYTPNADFFGTDTFTYHANDGNSDSNVATVTITVNGVNDAPSFTAGGNQTVNEGAGPQTVNPWATAIDDGDPGVTQTLTFNITGNTNAALFSAGPAISAAGVLTYTPAVNANGTANITVTLSDDGGIANGGDDSSDPQSFTITVNPVNNAPAFNPGPNQTVDEDSGAQSVSGWASGISAGPADESGQTVSFNVTGNTNSALFSAGPSVSATGVLTYTPVVNAFGSATITLTLSDNGGTANGGVDTSAPQSFTITVNAVNDAPSFVSGGNVTVLEDAGPQSLAWATGISPGPANESGQTLSFLVSNNNNALFTGQPTVSSSGALTFTSAPNAFGSATVMVTLQDNGGTANGGADSFGPLSFTITVTPVNDAPVATAKSHQTHSGIRVTIGASDSGRLKDGATDVDDPFGDLAVNATFTSITPAGATIALSNAATGTFTYNPPAGFSGAASFQFQACDDGVPTPPVMCSAPATVSFTVTGPDLWFVDDSAGAGGSGRLTDPFDALADLPGSRGNSDRIFVFSGTYGAGHTLLTSEQLIGQGASGTFDSVFGVTTPANGTLDSRPALGGARPQLNGTVTLAGSSTVRGLNISSSTATGLTDPVAAILGVTVSETSVTSTTGTAVNLSSTGGTVGLTAVSANGAANGIVLNNTTGSFTVTGNSSGLCGGQVGSGPPAAAAPVNPPVTADCTGGTIQSSTGPGIVLNNAQNISLIRMRVINGGNDGLQGTNVTGFSLISSLFDNNGNALNENGLDFGDSSSTTPNGLHGTGVITNSTVQNSYYNGVSIRNLDGVALTSFTVTGSQFRSLPANGDSNDSVFMEAGGTANMAISVTGSFFASIEGDHFQAAALNSGTLNVNLTNNTLTGGHSTPLGQGITINAATGVAFGGYTGRIDYDINGNNITGAVSNGATVALGTSSATAVFDGFVRNNVIGTSAVALSCSTQANGVYIDARGNGTHTSSVTGNTIRQCFDRGILSEAGDGDSVLNLTVTGNTIDQQVGALAREAIQTNHGITTTNVFGNVDSNAVCLQLGGAGALANTFSHGGGAPDDFRLRKRFESTVRLPGYAGGTGQDATSLGQVVTFIQGQNTGSAGEPGSASASGAGGGYTAGAACPLPL